MGTMEDLAPIKKIEIWGQTVFRSTPTISNPVYTYDSSLMTLIIDGLLIR